MSTRFVAAICPSCSGALQLPENLSSAKCSYCGAIVLIEKNIPNDEADEGNNLVSLADEARAAGNFSEAYELYSEALKLNPLMADAWMGKGTSAGWLSNLENDRFDEMKNFHLKGLGLLSSEIDLELNSVELGLEQFQLAEAFFDTSLQHVIEFISLREAQFEHADRICRVIDLCENAKNLNSEIPYAEFITKIAKRGSKIQFLDSKTKEYLLSKIAEYSGQLSDSVEGGESKSVDGGDAVSNVIAFVLFLLIIFGLVKCIG